MPTPRKPRAHRMTNLGPKGAVQRELFSETHATTRKVTPEYERRMEVPKPGDKGFRKTEFYRFGTKAGELQYFLSHSSRPGKPDIHIQFISIPEKMQNNRIGLRVLARFLFQAKKKHVHHVTADVSDDATVSQKLFERMGFSGKNVPLGSRTREEGYVIRYTLDLEHTDAEALVRRFNSTTKKN